MDRITEKYLVSFGNKIIFANPIRSKYIHLGIFILIYLLALFKK
jgi:hypothetical protein